MQIYSESDLINIFDEIIQGKNVKRTYHNLMIHDRDYTFLFESRLKNFEYRKTNVGLINIIPGFRVPGFLLRNRAAIFGYVFWEVFSKDKKRKLWGSVVRNKKGDWKYVVPDKQDKKLWINLKLIEEIYLPDYS